MILRTVISSERRSTDAIGRCRSRPTHFRLVSFWVAYLRLGRSLNTLECEPITSSPIGALRARISFWIIRALLVRAADNPIGHHGGAGCVRLEEGQNLLTNGGIMTHVQIALGEPTLKNIRLVTFSKDDADGNLGGQFVVGSVEGHSGDRVPAKSRAEFRVQPRSCGRPLFAKSLPCLHQRNIRRPSPNCRRPRSASEHQAAAAILREKHRVSEVLLAAKVAFCRQHRCMPQQELDLFEFPATGVTQLRARAT